MSSEVSKVETDSEFNRSVRRDAWKEKVSGDEVAWEVIRPAWRSAEVRFAPLLIFADIRLAAGDQDLRGA
jgi:hypothetical protein